MAAAKRSKKGESELQRDGDRDDLASGAEVAAQGDEGGPSKRVRATRNKNVLEGDKTASQLHEELNLEPLTVETNPESGEVNQGVAGSEQPKIPLVASDEVDYDGSESDSDRKGPRRSETPIARLKDEVKDIRAVMANLMDQNHLMIEILKSTRSASSDGTRPTYMENVPKPLTWDTRDKRNIEVFLTEYEAYCDASGYIGDNVRVRTLGPSLRRAHSLPSRLGEARATRTSCGMR